MGAFGSTRWGLTRTRDTVETNCSLDINRLNRAGCLQSGYHGGWEWKREGERIASIRFRRDGDALVLSYRLRRYDEEWQDVEQPTQIVWTRADSAGSALQREDRYDRALRRANKIRMPLGGEPGMASQFPDRPKGMHRQTYERLQSAVLNAEIFAEERLAILVGRLGRSNRRKAPRTTGRSRKEFWT